MPIDGYKIMGDREIRAHELIDGGNTPKDRVRRFVALEKERRELEARLDMLKKEIEPLAEQIAEEFEDTGTQRERVDGLTVFLKYTTWARPKDGDMTGLCQALKTTGYGDLVKETVNQQTLSAMVRERLQECAEENIPDALAFPAPLQAAMAITTTRKLQSITGQTPRSKHNLED